MFTFKDFTKEFKEELIFAWKIENRRPVEQIKKHNNRSYCTPNFHLHLNPLPSRERRLKV
jgi:hypothetical protein